MLDSDHMEELERECIDTERTIDMAMATLECKVELLHQALAAAEAECAEWRRNSGYVDTDGLWHVATHVPAYAVAEAANANDATRARLGLGRIGEVSK
jgi:hypothetical protein